MSDSIPGNLGAQLPESAEPLLEKVLVIGLGLIGGSFAKGLRERGLCREVIGYSPREETRRQAVELDVVDRCVETLEEGCRQVQLVQLAMPVLAMEETLTRIAALHLDDLILTDVGSVKSVVVRAAERAFGALPPDFIPGHPIAGSERSGVTAADAMLFEHHKVLLTPAPQSDAHALKLVGSLWRNLGATVEYLPVQHHDEVLAATSHLPHLLAFTLVDSLARNDESLEIFRYAAGGFRDFTRIAASDPVMWHDVFLSNSSAVLGALDAFTSDLQEVRRAIFEKDGEKLLEIFTRARVAREHFSRILAQRASGENMPIQQDTILRAGPGGCLVGKARVPGDKSISHRAIMLGALAEGVTHVRGFLQGEDALATLQAFRDMGVSIQGPENGEVTIEGVGLYGLRQPPGELYLGNSGTSMRLLTGLLSAQPFDTTLTGDDSLSKRPMNRVARPLRQMGAQIETGEEGRPPLRIKGSQALLGIDYDMPMASAQVKSCLLLAGLYASGSTSVTEPVVTRDHTERMLKGFQYPVQVEDGRVTIRSGGKLIATDIDVPADISSAAFFLVGASIVPGSELLLEHVGVNPTRTGVIDILRLMGADITLLNVRESGDEPVADIRVRSASLKGIEIPEELVPLAIDEFPVLFIAAACAAGQTVLRGAGELRVKESDRIQVMAEGLQSLGVKADPTPDGIIIQGGLMQGGEVWSHGDHRISMSFVIASLRASAPVVIHDCANISTSFPGFTDMARRLGAQILSETDT